MNFKITLLSTLGDLFFILKTNNKTYFSSEMISKAFGLDIDEYNKILLEKVIQHDEYDIKNGTEDLVFSPNRISKETYIDRFKEAFADQLILLTLSNS